MPSTSMDAARSRSTASARPQVVFPTVGPRVRIRGRIAGELTARGVSLSLGGSTDDPADPVGRLLFNILGMVAEFEADLIRMRTRKGMAVARARGRLRGKQPNLSAVQRKHVLSLYDAGEHTRAELAELFSVSRTTVYREIQRRGAATMPAHGP